MKWKKPSGLEQVTNDSQVTIDYCKSLGWKEDKPEIKKEVKKETKKPAKGK